MKIYQYFATFAATALFFSGCKKFVTVDAPYTVTATSEVFTDPITATSAQTGTYLQLFASQLQYAIARETGAYADELTNYSNDAFSASCYRDSLNALLYFSTWNSAYASIYSCNASLEGLAKSTMLSDRVKSQLTGEAEFTRAFLYFNLVNLYGTLPLITGTDYTQNQRAAGVSADEVYAQILKDLKSAHDKLDSNFVDGSSTGTTTERIRPSLWAAKALLARTYLYTGDYSNSEQMATDVIAHTTLFNLENDLNSVFLKNSNESIWQIQKTGQTFYNSDGYGFILQYYLSTSGSYNSSGLSPELIGSMEPGDNRATAWTGSYSDQASGQTIIFPYKYKETFTSNPTEYSTVLRLAEQYLIRAEARAQQDNATGALSDLNAIRHRAGLADYAGATDKASLLAAILHERQVELFTEWGHRWFDLKRTGNANTVMTAVAAAKGSSWSPYKLLWPIMQNELQKDPNMSQNPGY